MSSKSKSFRFPYVLIGLALLVTIFYRSPQGRGFTSQSQPATSIDDFPQPEIPSLSVQPVVKASVSLSQPVIAAPGAYESADLSRVSPPAVRTASLPDAKPVEESRAPEGPQPAADRVYLPDSYSHAVSTTPVMPEEMPGHPATPLRISIISHGNEAVNEVALTFDDGPNNRQTGQILEILKQYNVKGTFFVLGQQVRQHPDMLKRIVAEGHEVGNHSFSHAQLTHLNDERVRQELASTQEEIRKVLGYAPRLVRPPYGAYNQGDLHIFEEYGLNIVLWSVDTYDWKRKADSIVHTVNRDAKNGSIILMHDIKSGTVRVLPDVIQQLKERGFKLVTVSELTGLEPYDTTAPVAQTGQGQPGT